MSLSNCSRANHTNDAKTEPIVKQKDSSCASEKNELALLDLYSGCGGMSTGLCMGAHVACVNLVTASIFQPNSMLTCTIFIFHLTFPKTLL